MTRNIPAVRPEQTREVAVDDDHDAKFRLAVLVLYVEGSRGQAFTDAPIHRD